MNLTVPIEEGEIHATIRAPKGASTGCAIVYYHGGGMLYGDRDDLPEPYMEMIEDTGHTLIAMDYPLCPETALERSLALSLQALCHVVEHVLPDLCCTRYALFGRSAGAYLALKLADRMRVEHPQLLQPSAIWDFYGYWDLADPFTNTPNAHYLTLPAVDEATAVNACGPSGSLVLHGPKATRYALYVHARQQGLWAKMLGITDANASDLSLSPANLARLPPVFITASTGDNDVPLKQSKTLMRSTPRHRMHQVYYLEHDFDRDTSNPAGSETYRDALAYLDEALEPTER